jgi:uncharacterized repeat protein (TIGR01451 family)
LSRPRTGLRQAPCPISGPFPEGNISASYGSANRQPTSVITSGRRQHSCQRPEPDQQRLRSADSSRSSLRKHYPPASAEPTKCSNAMYRSNPTEPRSRASIADFTAWVLFALLLLAVALPAAAQTYSGPTVDLELTKDVDKQYAAVGEDVVYTIRVSNKEFYGSSANATNIFVKDYLPSGLTALEYSATTGGENGITFDHSTLTWNIEWLNAGQFVDLQFKARVNQVGEFKNCAEIWDADQKDVDSKTGAEAYGPLAGLYQGEDDEDCAEFWGVNSGSISGMVFEDLDGNGLFDNYEGGLAGFEIDLNTIGDDHTCGTYDDVEVAYTDSDDQGNYTFWDVVPGTYCVEIDDITIPYAFQRTTGNPVKVTVGAGEDVTGIKFGFLKPRVDLELSKVVDNESPTVGDTVTFTLTLTNNNIDQYGQIVPTATATGIQVKDYLPQGLWLVEGSTGYGVDFDSNQTKWTIDQLEAGKSVSLLLKARVENDGELTNCAEVWDVYQTDRDSKSGAEAYGELVGGADAEDDQDCASLWAQQRTIDLELTKVVDNAYPTVGDKVTFTLTLTNNDQYATVPTATATGIQVKDYLPYGLTFHEASAGYGITFDENATTWHIDQLEAGKSVSLVLTATVSKDGEFANCTEVWDANELDRDSKTGAEAYGELAGGPDAEDDQDCASLWASPRTIDLELSKVIDNAYPAVGDKVKFTLTLTNNDEYGTATTSTATGVQVKDYLPAGLGLHEAYAPAGTSFDSGSNTWQIDQLGAGKSLSLVLEVVVNTDGEFTNCAEVWDANEIDRDSKTGAEAYGELVGGPDAEDDQDCASLWVSPKLIDLEVTKTIDNDRLTVGDTAEFTITVTNNDLEFYKPVPTDKATNVMVTDYLPEGFWLVEGSSPYAGSNGVTFDETNLKWTIEWIAPGESVTLTLKARAEKAGEFENCAEVWDADQKDRDSKTGAEAYGPLVGDEDDQDCVSFWVVEKSLIDLEVDKAVDNANPKVGDTINFTITVTNNDIEGYQQVPTAKATNVFVKDYVPAGLWVIEGSSAYAGSNGVTFDTNSNTWRIEWIAAGQSVTLTLKARVDEKGEFENCAEVWDADQKDRDSLTGDEAGSPLAGSYEDDQDCVSYWAGPVTNPPAGKGSVTGVVFHDLNYNGVLDYGETGLAGFEVDLTDLGSDYVCGGYDDLELATDDTDAYGAYGFWDVDAGTYCVRILDVAIPYGYTRTSPDPVKVVVDAYGSVVVNFGFKANVTPPPPPPSGDALCYMVADNGGNGYGSADVLTRLNEGSYQDVVIGGTQTEQIEAIAFNPWNQKLYAADANRLGTLDLYTGEFDEVGEFGGGEGAEGWLAFLDVDGLTFDPYSEALFGSIRRTGERDLLIQIDAATGKAIKDAFGYGVDYLVIQPEAGSYYGPELNDIDDLAIDPESRKLYAINNLDGEDSRLVIIDPATGWITKVLELPVGNVEGLAFFNNGTLYGTAGEGDEAIIEINKYSLQATIHASIGVDGNRDYEAIDCLTAAPSYLSVAVFGDTNGDGVMQGFEVANAGTQVDLYRDMDEDGRVSTSDMLVATTTADHEGQATFAMAATGAFVVAVENAGSPVTLAAEINGFGMNVETTASGSMTTTANESEGDLPNGFGLSGNYPNPFNPQTTVRFETPESGRVRLSVHDVLGREVAVLVDGVIGAGSHDVTFDAADLPSGTYMARLSGTLGVQSRTMVLLK